MPDPTGKCQERVACPQQHLHCTNQEPPVCLTKVNQEKPLFSPDQRPAGHPRGAAPVLRLGRSCPITGSYFSALHTGPGRVLSSWLAKSLHCSELDTECSLLLRGGAKASPVTLCFLALRSPLVTRCHMLCKTLRHMLQLGLSSLV